MSFSRWTPILLTLLLAGPVFPGTGTRVVLEAAHGGADSGSRSSGQVEKTWNLKFAQALAQALNNEGLDTVQVRTKDETVTQEKRFEIINTSGAALALILHADRETSGKIRGPLFVVQPPQTNLTGPEEGLPEAGTVPLGRFHQSLRLARLLAAHTGSSQKFSSLSEPRAMGGEPADPQGSILAAPHESLRFAAIPAVVVTPLFFTNGEDLRKFSTDEAVAAFAKDVAQGVAAFLRGEGR